VEPGLLAASALSLLVPIHRSGWKENSANFALTEFSEVRASSVLWPVFVPWSTYTALTQEYAALVAWPTEIALKA
jgi:hypothetical protein